MSSARGWGVRRKLSLATTGTSVLALLVACGVFLWMERAASYRALEQKLETLSAIFAYNAAASLEFWDTHGASEMLAALSAQPEIRCGVLLDGEGEVFAAYVAAGARREQCVEGVAPAGRPPPELELIAGGARFSRVVELGGEHLGTFVVGVSLDAVRATIFEKTAIALAVTLACAFLAFVLTSRLVSPVTGPVLQLAQLARAVTQSQDYSQRAIVGSRDEVGLLAQALNQMLARIEGDKDLYAQRERLREINAMLENEKQRALAAVRAKSEFLANMSHEIRTPMTAILGYVDLLRNGEIEQNEVSRVLEVVRRNGHHLISVINDILDISKLESGQLRVESIDCPLCEIVTDVASLMRERAGDKGLAFEVRYQTRVPRMLESDPTRLRQVLLNLVSNAVKFTSVGFVRISVAARRSASPESPWSLSVRVEDSGPGIPADKHAVIFQPFAQADTSTTRRFGGTGLGLSISSTLTKLLGGDLHLLHSRVGEGSVFELELPIRSSSGVIEWVEPERASELAARAPREPARPSYPENLSGRILLAEDSVDNQRLMRLFLRRAGLSLDIAENGRVACEYARAAREAGTPYDVILMDMQMPELDGYAATAQLRAEGHGEPIIAFTAHAMIGERERCLSAGCDDFVTKPIDRAALLRLLQGYLK